MYKKEKFNVTPEWLLETMGKIRILKSTNYVIFGDDNAQENIWIEKALRSLRVIYTIDYCWNSTHNVSVRFRVTQEEFKHSIPLMYKRFYSANNN